MDLVSSADPILREPILNEYALDTEESINAAIQLAHDLVETMKTRRGLNLSAPQIGIKCRVIALEADPVIVCYNPRIVDASTEEIVLDETSIMTPGIVVKIKRPRFIKVRYAEPNGNIVTRKFDGMASRLFQQSIEQLDGINYISRAHPIHRERVLKKLEKLNRLKRNANVK